MAQSISLLVYEINGNPRTPLPPVAMGFSSAGSVFQPYNGIDGRLYGLVVNNGIYAAVIQTVAQLVAMANA